MCACVLSKTGRIGCVWTAQVGELTQTNKNSLCRSSRDIKICFILLCSHQEEPFVVRFSVCEAEGMHATDGFATAELDTKTSALF